MDKQLQQVLQKTTMYSKIGRYISNKILKYNKKSKTHRPHRIRSSLRQSQHNESQNKKLTTVSSVNQSRQSFNRTKIQMRQTIPAVGFYKINYNQIDKNTRQYNFNRSVPHFNRDKYYCNQSKHVYKDIPDSILCQQKIKGLTELSRIVGRQNIKGSIRKQIQDPHQNRFKAFKDYRIKDNNRTRVNFQKNLQRNNIFFKNMEHSPQYDYTTTNIIQKRLDTHIIPFQKIIERKNKALHCETGISDYFNQYQLKHNYQNIQDWKKMLARSKTGLMPSYMDKNINTRSSIGLLNLKTLEMNCTDFKDIKDVKKIKKKKIIFVQEDNQINNKQNMDIST